MKKISYKEQSLSAGMLVPPSEIGLPTNGAILSSVDFVTNEEGHGITGDFYRICGSIHPFDLSAYEINFQMGFPVTWNGRLIQYGGGGLNGMVTPAEAPAPGRAFMSDTPIKEGYAFCSSDSGHIQDPADPNSCHWALNQEALENYAYKALKKVCDLAVFLIQKAYGINAEKIYFAGASNGGRECLKAIENYPDDYDGAICFYPANSFIAKVLFDNHYGTKMQQLGEKCIISSEKFHEIQKKIIGFSDEADGLKDGLVSNLAYAKAHRRDVYEMLSRELSAEQLEMLDVFAAPYILPFDLGYGPSIMPEYAVYEGAPLYEILQGFTYCNMYCSEQMQRDNFHTAAADQILACMVMKDPQFDVLEIEVEKIKAQLQTASLLLDASANGSGLERFASKGGKMILLHGMSDPMITPYCSILYYNQMLEYYGKEKLNEFLRFYMVPGYGHGFGENYGMHTDVFKILDSWVCEDNKPDVIITEDSNDTINHRTRPIYEYPYYPVYNGTGEENNAKNFHPEIMDISQFEK